MWRYQVKIVENGPVESPHKLERLDFLSVNVYSLLDARKKAYREISKKAKRLGAHVAEIRNLETVDGAIFGPEEYKAEVAFYRVRGRLLY